MIDFKNPKIKKEFDAELENLFASVDGLMASTCAQYNQPSPIEQIMFIFLTSLSIQEHMHQCPMLIEPQKQIGSYLVDFLVTFMGEQLVIECDGHDFHERTKEQAQKDKLRDRTLQRLGFKVFRFTGSELWSKQGWRSDIILEIDAMRAREFERRYGKNKTTKA